MLFVALAVLVASFAGWLTLSAAVVVGRVLYDRQRETPFPGPLDERRAQRLIRRASRGARTEWGRWRRTRALTMLARAHHPAAPRLLRPALASVDVRVAHSAVRSLGDLGDDWAVNVLIGALRDGVGSRSRIAAELERLAPIPGPRLPALLRDWDPEVRFWGATLLAPYPDLADASLAALSWDSDPNVRAAAVETLGARDGPDVQAAVLALLNDSAWFVRVHAARAAGHVVGAPAASTICELLADEKWWVRTAAKDALRTIGRDAVPSLLSVLVHADGFARNGAAEVLQDIGYVDALALDDPTSPILKRIYEAGGERLRDAAETRAASRPRLRSVQAA